MQRLLTPSARVVKPTGATNNRLSDLLAAILFAAAFALIQILIGGTRLLFSLPAYGLLAAMAFLTVVTVRRRRPNPNQLCLVATAVFLAYILVRALLSPVHYL